MEDKDDRFTYSDVVKINYNRQDAIVITISPNPAFSDATISFNLLQKQRTQINIYDMTGRLVKILANAELQAGRHELHWNIKDKKENAAGAGIYFLKMQAVNFHEAKRLVVVK
jgi:flagellar hook assembly protein FlgD